MSEHEGFVSVDGVSLYYRSIGAGEPVLLIHAANTDGRMWQRSAELLSERYRVICYDMRGMGRSQGGAASFAVSDDIDAVLASNGIDRCCVAGVSAGGYCALEYALQRPSRVSALVLVSTGLFGVQIEESSAHHRDSEKLGMAIEGGNLEQMVNAYASMWLDGPDQPETRVAAHERELFLEMARGCFLRRQENRFPVSLDPPAAVRLNEISCRTLVVDGQLDFEETHAFARLFEREIRGARRVTMAGVAHLPPLEQPGAFSELLEDFLEAREPGHEQ